MTVNTTAAPILATPPIAMKPEQGSLADTRADDAIALSVVVPAKNEADNLPALCREIAMSLNSMMFEIIVIDDASTDHSARVLQELRASVPQVRILRHRLSSGQSAAIRSGVLAARGAFIATIDGDGQNLGTDIPRLWAQFNQAFAQGQLGMVAGQRVARKDTWSKRIGSKLANGIRQWALGDNALDSGCGLKLLPRALFVRLPYFDHMHRFMPALVRREGFPVRFIEVGHRPRRHGTSNYGNIDRLLVGVIDLMGVMWLMRRAKAPNKTAEL